LDPGPDPLVLILLGSLLGGVFAVGAVLVNLATLRSAQSNSAKAVVLSVVLIGAVIGWLVALVLIRTATGTA
jgi:hypothetical protein